ncbi:hypothetical protein [Pleomorphomonas sp. PLEO]|uniref:DUF6984 family protein n=1 Tax=Pleomorphomonas sp. PLEO TaxID=3239306 RepID=UPI00351F290D
MSRAWRQLTDRERRLVEKLLSPEFPGCERLRAQLETARVSIIDADGSLEFRVSGPSTDVEQRVPTEGYYFDAEGVGPRPAVHVLLHVVDGMLHELEVYKDDGSPIETPIDILDLSQLHLE